MATEPGQVAAPEPDSCRFAVIHHPAFTMLICGGPPVPGGQRELRRYFLAPAQAAELAAQLTTGRPAP